MSQDRRRILRPAAQAVGRAHDLRLPRGRHQRRPARRSRRPDDEFEFVQARHEEMAAFMACAYAKFSGEIGVCLSTGGPGATHLITGLYDAKLDHMPVLAITGQAQPVGARRALPAGAQPRPRLRRRRRVRAGRHDAAAGRRRSSTGRSAPPGRATASPRWSMPNDLLGLALRGADARARLHPLRRPATREPHVVPARGRPAPRRRGAERRQEGRASWSAPARWHATDEVIAVADRLQAGAAKALLGKAALPDDLPWVTGTIGLLGSKPSSDMMDDCDTLLMIGTGFPWSEFLPKSGQARGGADRHRPDDARHPLSDRGQPARRQRRDACARCCRCSSRRPTRRGASGIERRVDEWWALMEQARPAPTPSRSIRSASPGSSRRGCRATSSSPRDSGCCANWYARDLTHPARHDVLALRRPRVDGRGGALRDRRQVRPSRPAGDRARRRRRHADEQHGRADHRREVLADVGEPELDLLRLEQRGPEPGHLGAAGHGGLPAVRGDPADARTCPTTASPS